jgi:hypothetical protein
MPVPSSWRDDVAQLIAENLHHVDSGSAERTVDLVTDDFTMTIGPTTLDRAQYAEIMQRRAQAEHQTRHCFSNLRLVDGNEASVTVAYVATVHRLEPGDATPSTSVSDWTEEWVQAGGGWKARSRVIAPFVAPTLPT